MPLLASSREVGKCAFARWISESKGRETTSQCSTLFFNFRGRQKRALRLEHCLSILCFDSGSLMDAQLRLCTAFPRLPGSQAPNPKHVKLCFEMPRTASPDGAIPHAAMPRPDLTSPGPRHGRQGPNNSVHESTKHGRPMSRRRGNLHLWTRESGIRKKPLISNPHLLSYRCTAFVCLHCQLSASIPSLCYSFPSPHTLTQTHTQTSKWVVCLRTSRMHAARLQSRR